VNAPPSKGPMTEAMPKTAPMTPVYIGRLWRGTALTSITIAPENIPQEPRPAIARPAMKAFELGAEPQITEPTSKIAMQLSQTTLGL